mmetsp:Transcript_13008/g.17988  ORF Transcript_13008/g.17988 Transcript_13008/m.17988 type:complete len:88 (-) Transcript_13008:635-898(-)
MLLGRKQDSNNVYIFKNAVTTTACNMLRAPNGPSTVYILLYVLDLISDSNPLKGPTLLTSKIFNSTMNWRLEIICSILLAEEVHHHD